MLRARGHKYTLHLSPFAKASQPPHTFPLNTNTRRYHRISSQLIAPPTSDQIPTPNRISFLVIATAIMPHIAMIMAFLALLASPLVRTFISRFDSALFGTLVLGFYFYFYFYPFHSFYPSSRTLFAERMLTPANRSSHPLSPTQLVLRTLFLVHFSQEISLLPSLFQKAILWLR